MTDDPLTPSPLKLAVLLSGGGTTMVNLADRIADGRLPAQIVRVIASNDAAGGIDRARERGLRCDVVRRKDFADTAAFSEHVFDLIREAGAELVCLAGFLSLLAIPQDFERRVLNIHPALLPAFGGRGMHGRHVHQAVLAAGVKVTGCTVHFADNTYDTGPILVQQACPVLPGDDAAAVAARVFERECEAYPAAIAAIAQGRVRFENGVAQVEPA